MWENPIPGLRHLGLRAGRFLLVPESLVARLPGPLAFLPVTDRLPAVELLLVWRPDTAPPAVKRLVETARDLARATAAAQQP